MTNVEKYIIKPFDKATDEEKRLVGPHIFGDNAYVFFKDQDIMFDYLDKLGIPHQEKLRAVQQYIYSYVQDKEDRPTLEKALRMIKEIRDTGGKGPYKIKSRQVIKIRLPNKE
ncbi:hypothetical protein [Nosocomiicoccus massiliensis]|uniref:Uncharacterized protein n=1 Tax=Nosocomiicoccus massiliensis TaxID=1232430 RepID=A0AAF0YNE3_9STAP|nr:hypothetical protein [Nosocomiicoccus massiliensis]WOS96684.1 hypothetical protein CJ229_002770 [Nosocomiicoccus massiliensis]